MKITLEKAIDLLKSDNIVAVPTETVYGLAARYDSEKAIHAVFNAKNRPLDHPLIVHVATIESIYDLAEEIKPYVFDLIKAFWPGPLTLVLKKKKTVSDLITANQDTVAIRMPDHPLLLDLIKKLGKPIVAPSANAFCKTSPTTADHVENNFLSAIPVLDGGPCKVGIESTIILATEDSSLTLLRPGILSKKAIESIAKNPFLKSDTTCLKIPGKKKVHYQPKVPIIAFEKNTLMLQNYLNNTEKKCFVMCFETQALFIKNGLLINMPHNPLDYSPLLYKKWYSVSDEDFDHILIELPPNEDQWQGIRDRILKATTTRLEEGPC